MVVLHKDARFLFLTSIQPVKKLSVKAYKYHKIYRIKHYVLNFEDVSFDRDKTSSSVVVNLRMGTQCIDR